MKLTHWSADKKLKLDHKYDYYKNSRRMHMKPSGFWLSVNDDWEDWLVGNWDVWKEDKIQYELEMIGKPNLIILESGDDFRKLWKELMGWECDTTNAKGSWMTIGLSHIDDFHNKLKEKYDGIFMKSSCVWSDRFSCTFTSMYVYGWDCESICIWNTKFVKIKERVYKEKPVNNNMKKTNTKQVKKEDNKKENDNI